MADDMTDLEGRDSTAYGSPIECTCKGDDKPHASGLRGCVYGPGGVLDGRDPLTPHNADGSVSAFVVGRKKRSASVFDFWGEDVADPEIMRQARR